MKEIDLRLLLVGVLTVWSLNSLAGQNAFTLTVIVDGAQANSGQAIASLFSSADDFLKEPVSTQVLPINDTGEARFTFGDLAAGTYSVSIVYDEDGNGKLNTGFFGIPSELVGFSNNAKGTFGPPSFEETAFSLPEVDVIAISLGQANK